MVLLWRYRFYFSNIHSAISRRGAPNKVPVFALLQRSGDVRSFKVDRVTVKNLKSSIRQHVDKDAKIMADELLAYKGLGKEFADHQTVNHGTGEYVRGNAHTNCAEGYFGLLKRGIFGTYHHVSKQHLDRYLAEFNFRYNSRKVEDSIRMMLAIDGVKGRGLVLR